MGTPDFAVGILQKLIETNHNVVGVVTVPDKPAGRGRQLRTSAVKDYVMSLDSPTPIKLMQPEKLRSEEFHAELKELNADLFIVVAFRMLPEVVWAMPRLGTFNLHGSLLPDYRGAAPINWVIMNGDTKTGVTTFLLNHEIDCGKILAKQECEIAPDDNVEIVHDNLRAIGADLVVETVSQIAEGTAQPIYQNVQENTQNVRPAPKLFKEMMELTFSETTTVQELHNKVRGLSPYPAAWAVISPENKEAVTSKIFRSHIEPSDNIAIEVGTWQTDGKSYIRVAALGGWLYIDELQPQNKKRMAAVDFLRGWR